MITDHPLAGELTRTKRGAQYFLSKPGIDDVAIVVKRFPRREGATSAASFVLVHGIGVSSRYYHPVAEELARHGEVFLVDLPGFGSAPDPRHNVSIEEHARVLAGFLSLAGLQNPVLVGHSMGSQVVSRLAVDHPEISDRFVLVGPTAEPGHRTFLRQAWRLLVDITRETPAVNAVVFTDYLFRCGVPYFLRQLPNLLEDRIEDRLPSIEAPTLVLRGDRDPIVPREWAKRVAELLPNGSFAEVSGPHVIMHSDPVGTAAMIVRHAA
jgi:pimeloyl-ACP methyl ester carboxylesterase